MKAIALISCVLAAMSVTARAQHNINTCIERATTNVVCGSVANPGEITNTVFCVEQGADLPYPEFIREPTYNNGRITITKTHSDCSTTTTNIDVTYTTSFFGFSPAPPNTSRLGVYTSSCHVLGLSSHPNYCPHIRINYGNVTWHIVPTNCVELGIIFADASGWKVVKVDFIGGAGSVVLQYDGFTVTYEAKVKVLCQCGCSFSEKDGTRVVSKTFDSPNDYFAGWPIGNMPAFAIPLPRGLYEALGELIAEVIDEHFPRDVALAEETLNEIAGRIRAGRPTSASAGEWKGGRSPCNN